MKKIFSLFLLIITGMSLYADVTVDPKNHIQNTDKGLCAWASVETLGRTHGWDEIKGLTASKDGPPYHKDLLLTLDSLKVKYRSCQIKETEWWYTVWYQESGKTAVCLGTLRDEKEAWKIIKVTQKAGDYWVEKKYYWKSDFLWKAIDDGLGVAVSFDKPGSQRHMMNIISRDDKVIRCIDSNYPRGDIRIVPLQDFLKWWNGFAVAIEKKS